MSYEEPYVGSWPIYRIHIFTYDRNETWNEVDPKCWNTDKMEMGSLQL